MCVSSTCVCVFIDHPNPHTTHTYTYARTDGPHQQVGILQRRHQREVALPRGEDVEEELVQRNGEGLQRGGVPVDQLCGVMVGVVCVRKK